MSIDTKLKIIKDKYTSIVDIALVISKILEVNIGIIDKNKYLKVSIKSEDNKYEGNKEFNSTIVQLFITLNRDANQFENNKENRTIWLFHYPNKQDKKNYVHISFGAWGSNKEIANLIIDHFGGIADYNDCDGIEIDYAKPQPRNEL
jgi:hypothetical protein